MPKSPIKHSSGLSARPSATAWLAPSVLWGVIAGTVIGAGTSLSTDIPSGSDDVAMSVVMFISAVAGGVFGRVVAHLLLDGDVSFLGRAAGGEHHRIKENPTQRLDLTDYRTLKARQLQSVPAGQVLELMESVRARPKGPKPLSFADASLFNLALLESQVQPLRHRARR